MFFINIFSDQFRYINLLQKDNDIEYFRNRCDTLEQQNKELLKKNKQLQEENLQLKEEIIELKKTVSALVARNIRAKPNKTKLQKKNPSKHARKSRNKSTYIDCTVTVDQKECNTCGAELSNPTDSYTRTVEDIIPAKAIITQYTIVRRYCRNCKKQISANIHTALSNERFGIRLMVLIVSLKTIGLSYGKISHLLQMLFSLHITESAINHAVSKVAKAFDKKYHTMIAELKNELNIHGDETSWRVNGKNYWLWAFVGKWTVIYEIDKSRSTAVPKRILKEYNGNITSDSYPAWNHVGSTHQKCHIHYIREIDDTISHKNPGPEFSPFAKRLKKIIYDSHIVDEIKSEPKRLLAKKNLERRIFHIISKQYKEKNCIRFVKRLRREREMLFTFLVTGTDSHNNTAERAIRPNVLIRKITNGNRSEKGADSHKVLMSIRETCRVRDLNFFDYTMDYLGNFTSKL